MHNWFSIKTEEKIVHMRSQKVTWNDGTFTTEPNLAFVTVPLKTSYTFKFLAEWLFSLSGKKYDMETTYLFFAINVMVRRVESRERLVSPSPPHTRRHLQPNQTLCYSQPVPYLHLNLCVCHCWLFPLPWTHFPSPVIIKTTTTIYWSLTLGQALLRALQLLPDLILLATLWGGSLLPPINKGGNLRHQEVMELASLHKARQGCAGIWSQEVGVHIPCICP